jgi:hypothetical protein
LYRYNMGSGGSGSGGGGARNHSGAAAAAAEGGGGGGGDAAQGRGASLLAQQQAMFLEEHMRNNAMREKQFAMLVAANPGLGAMLSHHQVGGGTMFEKKAKVDFLPRSDPPI